MHSYTVHMQDNFGMRRTPGLILECLVFIRGVGRVIFYATQGLLTMIDRRSSQ